MKRNKASPSIIIDLQGVALGNPWTDPFTQYDVSDFMHGLGIITHGQKNKCKETERLCQSALKQGKLSSSHCYRLLDDIIAGSGNPNHVLMYDARQYVASQGVFPPGKGEVVQYLNRGDVRAAIHASNTPQKFVECADLPFNALAHQDGKGALKELVEVLNDEKNVKVLVYNGQFDIICNHLGNERFLEHLDWKDRNGWLLSNNVPYQYNNQPVGYIKAFGNLGFLLVRNSGHMVSIINFKHFQSQLQLSLH